MQRKKEKRKERKRNAKKEREMQRKKEKGKERKRNAKKAKSIKPNAHLLQRKDTKDAHFSKEPSSMQRGSRGSAKGRDLIVLSLMMFLSTLLEIGLLV